VTISGRDPSDIEHDVFVTAIVQVGERDAMSFVPVSYTHLDLVGDPNSGTCKNGAKVGSATCFINTSAFAEPAFGTYGNQRQNQYRSARYWDVDASVFRQFPLWSESRRLEFRAEAFNLFNTTIFNTPGFDASTPAAFGIVTSAANTAREMQFGLKIIF